MIRAIAMCAVIVLIVAAIVAGLVHHDKQTSGAVLRCYSGGEVIFDGAVMLFDSSPPNPVRVRFIDSLDGNEKTILGATCLVDFRRTQ